jgi:hypothetical protein
MTSSKERKIFFLKIFENQNIFGCRLRRDNNQSNVNLPNAKKSKARNPRNLLKEGQDSPVDIVSSVVSNCHIGLE